MTGQLSRYRCRWGKQEHGPRLVSHVGHIPLLDSLGHSTRFYTFGNPRLRGGWGKLHIFKNFMIGTDGILH